MSAAASPPRVLCPIEWSEPLGGMEKSMLLLCKGLIEHRLARPIIVLPQGTLASSFREIGAEVHVIGTQDDWRMNRLRDIRAALRLAWRLRRVAASTRSDVVHVNNLQLAALLSWLALPVIWHHRAAGGFRRHTSLLATAVLRRVQLVLVPSQAAAAHVAELGGSVNPLVVVVPNPVELSLQRREEGTPRNVVLVVGRLVPYKGFDVAVRAFSHLRTCLEAELVLRLVVVGRQPEHEELLRQLTGLAMELGVLDGLEIVRGPVPLGSHMEDAVVVWMPSRLESFGRIAAEAMANGIPVVGARVGGLPEVIQEPSQLFPPEGWKACAEATARLLTAPMAYEKAVREGYLRAAQYEPMRIAEQVRAAYDQVLT